MLDMSAIVIEPNAFAITVVFIALATFVAAFVRGRKRDKCLRDFAKAPITLQLADGKCVWGRLTVENTGLELTYDDKHADQLGHAEASFILYKHEFGNICALVRFFDDLSDREKKQREKVLKRTWHPGPLSRWRRRLANIFRTVRDSIMEVANLLLARAQKTARVGQVLTTQDKYVSRMKTELTGAAGTSYEPLLERHIGRKVVFEMAGGESLVEYSAVLKEYTTEFIELMDVQYGMDDLGPRRGDIIVPRSRAIVRHLGE